MLLKLSSWKVVSNPVILVCLKYLKFNLYLYLCNLYEFNIYLSSSFLQLNKQSFKLKKPPEFGGKWGAECLNTRVPPSILQHAGYTE